MCIRDSSGVGREAGAVDVHVPVGQRLDLFVYGLTALIHLCLKVTGSGAHFFTDYRAAAGLYDIVDLPVGNGHRSSGQHDPLGPFLSLIHI